MRMFVLHTAPAPCKSRSRFRIRFRLGWWNSGPHRTQPPLRGLGDQFDAHSARRLELRENAETRGQRCSLYCSRSFARLVRESTDFCPDASCGRATQIVPTRLLVVNRLLRSLLSYYTGRPVSAGRSGGQHQKTLILPGGGVEGVSCQIRPAGALPNQCPLLRPAGAWWNPQWAVRPTHCPITTFTHRPADASPNHHLYASSGQRIT
jgi:hypothetical protein